MSKEIKERIYLASLLHDIGKFFQRADSEDVEKSRYLSDENKNNSLFHHHNDGKLTRNHALWTAQFIETHQSVFQKLTGMNELPNKSDRDGLIYLSAGHHLSEEKLSEAGQIIKKANGLASGLNWNEKELTDRSSTEINNREDFRFEQVDSLFENMQVNKEGVNRYKLPVTELSLSKSIFPSEKKDKAPDYERIWTDFVKEFKSIQSQDIQPFCETLLALLYKYTWCVPDRSIDHSDISLFDHSKTTAALAVALYDYSQSSQKGVAPFLLIGGDLSGIQNYIYQVASKYAGRSLKGRSFYLYLLTDSIVRYLLRTLNLFNAQVIYNSGGSFYMLAPNTQELKDKLATSIQEIERYLFNTHGTSLFVSIDSVELSENALTNKQGENLKSVWDNLFTQRDVCKQRRFHSLLQTQYRDFFEPINIPTDKVKSADAISGEEFRVDEKQHKLPDTNYWIKEITLQQIALGGVLSDVQYMIVSDKVIHFCEQKKIVSIEPAGLQTHYYFPSRKDISSLKDELKRLQHGVSIITLNGENGKCEFINGDSFGHNHTYNFSFYGGNEKKHTSFEDFCKRQDIQTGILRMGVLRMDVDNLGKIFREGIPHQLMTLSRYTALSRSFDYFFSGYINTVWQEVDPEQTFVLYSGGDDLFIIGAWQSVIDFGERIRKDFSHYTCNNSMFSISGGMAIIENKYPIMRGAEESGHMEKRAKEHAYLDSRKNSFCILSMPLNWQHEYPLVKELKEQIVMALMNGLPKSFLSKILQHHSNARIKNNRIQEYKTFWMMSYDLGRMKQREKKWVTLIELCLKDIYSPGYLLGKEITTKYHPLELWALAARWAELEVRTTK